MAQIHALLLITGRPHSVDDLMERLHISRGNASMNLRDLMDWGIITRFRKPGDRKDVYKSHSDVWHMFARVVRERKRRELDPTVAAIRECMAMVPQGDRSDEAELARDRLGALLEVFGIIDGLYQQVFESDESFRKTMQMIESGSEQP